MRITRDREVTSSSKKNFINNRDFITQYFFKAGFYIIINESGIPPAMAINGEDRVYVSIEPIITRQMKPFVRISYKNNILSDSTLQLDKNFSSAFP